MKIGTMEIQGKAVLAPMAGVTDRPFRRLCRQFGAAYCVTEMVSAKALQFNDKKTPEIIIANWIQGIGKIKKCAFAV